MSLDVIFSAVFPTPKPAALRFAEFWEFLGKRAEFHGPGRVRVYELINSGQPIVKEDDYTHLDAAIAARVKGLLTQYGAEKYSFRGTWLVRGTRNGQPTQYGIEITFRSPLTRCQPPLDRNVDVSWDLGNIRRYLEDHDDQPNHEQIIGDLQVLIEFGACSVWGSTAPSVNPLELYAMYHRDPNEYHADNSPQPLVKWPIDEEDLIVALANARKAYEVDDRLRLFETRSGPIVYSPLLARGTLNIFYTYLGRMLQAGVLADVKRTPAAGFKAYERTFGQKKWIVVERSSDGAEIVRVDWLQQEADTLTIAHEIIEPGFNDQIIRWLIPLAVLEALYGGAYRDSVTQFRYLNKITGTEDLLPLEF